MYPICCDVVRIRFEKGGAFVYVRGKGKIYELNETGALVLKLADGQHELHEIVEAVKESFQCESSITVSEDVQELVDSLHALGILNV